MFEIGKMAEVWNRTKMGIISAPENLPFLLRLLIAGPEKKGRFSSCEANSLRKS